MSLEDLNHGAEEWTRDVANQRIHGATKEKPHDLWITERDALQFPEIPAYNTSMLNMRHSTKDGLIQYKSCFYSVPRECALKKLYIRDVAQHGLPMVEVYYQDKLIATHPMSFQRGRWVTKDEHLTKADLSEGVSESSETVKGSVKYRRPHLVVAQRDLSFYNFLLEK